MTRKSPKVRASPRRGKTRSRGDRNIAWIEKHCRIPEGQYVGRPVRLIEAHRKIVRAIYNSPTRRAIVSFGRKNAKTTLAALLLVLHVAGPEGKARPNSQLYSAAQSRDQAAIVFALAAKIIRMSPGLSAHVIVRDTAKELFCPELGTLYKALSAEHSTAYGYSPSFIVHDELGQVKGPRSALYEALETATAAQAEPLSIIISTQAPTDADLLSVLIDDGLTKADPLTKVFLFSAPMDADPFAVETIRQANPAFDEFQNQAEVLAMAESARRMPSREAEYRNLVLNQRVERVSPLISVAVWKANGENPTDQWDGPVYGALDLADTTDLAAQTWVTERDGLWHVRPTFWLPAEGLRERSRQDRVPYDLWHDQGFLETTPGKSIAYEYVAQQLVAAMATMDVRKIGFDRWNFRHFRPWLVKAGLSEERITEVFVEFGQGYKDMTPAVRTLEERLLNAQLRHGGHPVLTMCAANAVVKRDEAGGRKLDKLRSRGRIDGMVALAMALGVASEGVPSLGYVDEPMVVL